MNVIELCKLARQAGIGMFWRVGPLARFAKLVAEREREACAKHCEAIADRSLRVYESGEAGAHEGLRYLGMSDAGDECADAIRARRGIG